MYPASPSGITLIVDLALAVILALYFALGRPRTWYRDRLGWVIFSYAAAVVGLLALIVAGVVFRLPIPPLLVFLISVTLGATLAAKILAVYRERREGRRAGMRPEPLERNIMTTPKSDAIKKATEIWYKAQRVLRTAFTTILTALPLVPQVIAIVQGQWDAAWLGPIAVQAVAINSALTAIIALPKVNAWLVKIGLGSVPRSAVYTSPATGSAHVKTDPKVVQG